jgi:serine phosphatase RsbU (regulator of sigma subunit)
MRQPKITVVAPPDACTGWLERVLEVWPIGVAPAVEVTSAEDLIAGPRSRDPGVLVMWCTGENRAAVESVLEWADRAVVPSLVVRAPHCNPPSRLPPDAIVLPATTDAGVAAGVLAGLAAQCRQKREALEELESMRAAQRSARQELDRLNEELHMASRVQAEFMHKSLPEMAGLDVSVLFRPCGYVSGDVYDVRVLDDRRVGVFLADAMGHGVPAALMTLALCRLLPTREATASGSRVLQPAEAMERLNRALVQNAGSSSNFATAVYAVIDLGAHRAAVCGAGHPPPLVFAPGGRCAFETRGPVLGVFEDACFDQVEFPLLPGQTLVLHTDGLEQAFPSADDRASLARPTRNYLTHLDDLVAAAARRGWSMDELTLRLGTLLDEQTGSLRQRDDVTVLAITPRARAASDAA